MNVTQRPKTPRAVRGAPAPWSRPTWSGAGRALLVCALMLGLGFRAGGFYAGVTGLAALVLALGLAVQVLVAAQPFAGWSGGVALASGALALYAAWTLVSVAW